MAKISLEEKEKVLEKVYRRFKREICGNSTDNNILKVREMVFPERAKCLNTFNAVRAAVFRFSTPHLIIPNTITANYFTYLQKHESKLKARLNYYRDRAAMGESSFIGNILLKKFGIPTYVSRLKRASVELKDFILDVGLRTGILLHKMKESGFRKLTWDRSFYGANNYISQRFKNFKTRFF
ncbi:MAG: hypothetical protein IPH11_10260 [Ignavibacteriales bacterium]|nr:hypothetical protein [Ignavibacteriales bacterium]